MRRLPAVACLTLVIGCGGDDADELQGSWVINNPGATCAIQAGFVGTAWELFTLCSLTNGSTGIAADTGTYVADGRAATMTTTHSTCQGVGTVDKVVDITYARQGPSLTVTLGTTVLLFQMATQPPGGAGVGTLGCFDASGAFTPNPLTLVP